MMRRILAVLSAIILSGIAAGKADAYVYRHSAGLEIGNLFAFDYRYRFTEHSAVDAAIGVVNPFCPSYQFLLVSTAYHYNFRTGVDRLYPYVGGGLSAGTRFGHWNEAFRTRISFFMSVDIPVGVEYRVKRKPVVFCLEWSPKLQFLTDLRFVPQSVALGVRFILPQM